MTEFTENQDLENGSGRTEVRNKAPRKGPGARKKIFSRVIVNTPSRNAAEVAILTILQRAPAKEMKTKLVLQELRSAKWFPQLNEDDLKAVYEKSRKNLFDSIVKFSKKALVLKTQVLPVGEDCEFGVWKITTIGIERALREGASWTPSYARRPAVLLLPGENEE